MKTPAPFTVFSLFRTRGVRPKGECENLYPAACRGDEAARNELFAKGELSPKLRAKRATRGYRAVLPRGGSSSLGLLSLGLFFFGFLFPTNLSAGIPPSISLDQTLATCIGSSPQVNLAWTSTFGTTPTYHILRRVQGSSSFQEINAVTTTSSSDLAVVSDQSYEYQIKADDGTISNISLPTDKPYCPPTLTNPAPYCQADGPHMSISWSSVSGNVANYEVHRINPDSTDIPFTVPAGTSSYDDGPALAGSSSYQYYIRAFWQDGMKNDSAHIPQVASSCPVILNGLASCQDVAPGGPSVHLSWNSLLGVTKYQIYRKAQNESTYSLLPPEVIGATSADDTLINSLPNAYDVAGKVSYTIKTSFANGQSDSSPFSPDIPQCAPFLSTQNNCQNFVINLSWTKTLGVDNYNIYRTDLSHSLVQRQPNETSYVDGLDSTNCPGAKCTKTYRVEAVAGFITKSSSSVTQSVDCSVLTPPNPPPTLKTPAAYCVNGDSHISLSWTPSDNVYYYTVYRDSIDIGKATNTSFDEKVQSENSFTYFVTAFGPGGYINSTNAPTIQSVSCIPPSASTIDSVTPSCSAGNPVNTIAWSPSSNTNIIRYEILRGLDSSSLAPINSFDKSAPEYKSHAWTDSSGLSPSTNYYYRVVSWGPQGVASVNSINTPSVPSASCIPNTPTISSITPSCFNGTPQLALSWSAGGPYTKSYNIYRADKGNTPIKTINDPATTAWTDISGAPATSYQYKVEAVGYLSSQKQISPPFGQTNYNCSPPSAFTLDPPAPSFCQNVSTPAVTLSWKDSVNALSYTLIRTNPSKTFTPVTSPYIDSIGLIPGISSTWKVQANGPPGVLPTLSNSKTLPVDYCKPFQPVLTLTPKCGPSGAYMSLAWSPADVNVTTYKVYRNDDLIKTLGGRSWDDTNNGGGLEDNKSYTYRIKASGPTLSNESTDTSKRTLFCATPSQPQNVQAQFQCVGSNATIPRVSITWDPSSNVTYYVLTRVLNSLPINFILGNLTSYFDNGINAGESNYLYYVVAKNAGGSSPQSQSVLVNPDSNTKYYCKPSTPILNSSNATCKNAAPANTLTWTDPIQSDTASYNIYRGVSNNLLKTINSGTPEFISRAWQDTISLNPSTLYSYWIKAIGPAGQSTLSAPLPITTANCATLPTPALKLALACSNNFPIPTLSWDNITGALSYDLSRTNPDTSVSTYATINSPFTDNGDFALSFNGVNNYVDAASPNALNINSNMSLFAWVNLVDTSKNQTIIEEANNIGAGVIGSYYMGVSNVTSRKVSIFWNNTLIDTSNGALQNNTWYLIGFTRSGSTGSWTNSIYINGALDKQTTTVTNPVTVASQSFSIGRHNAAIPIRFVSGSIDDTRIYSRMLNSDEVSQLYTQGSSGNELGLKGFWNFNEGQGATAQDTSGNGNNGTIVGTPVWVSPVGKPGYGAPLDNKLQYTYKLKALGTGNVSPASQAFVPASTSCLPAKPDVSAAPYCQDGKQQINISWHDDPNPINTLYWNIYKRQVGKSFGLVVPPSPVASPPAPYIDSNVTSGISYEYFVSAHGPNAGISPTDSDLTPAIQAPFCQNIPAKPVFTPLTPVARCLGTSPRIYMSWGKDSTGNTLAYNIYRDLADDSDTKNATCTVLPSDPLECWDKNVAANESHQYWIKALGSGQGNFTKSDISSPDTIVNDCSKVPPDPPHIVFGNPPVSSIASKQTVWLEWQDVGNADQYQIFRRKEGETTFALAPWWEKLFFKNALADFANPLGTRIGTHDGATKIPYPDNSPAEATKYEYLVRAINANGLTDSNVTNPGILVPIGTPGQFTLSGSPSNLAWTAADTSPAGGPVTYTVYRDVCATFNTPPDANPPSCIPTAINCPNANTLQPDMLYHCSDPSPSGRLFYKVAAQNNGGKTDSNTLNLKLPLPTYKEMPPKRIPTP